MNRERILEILIDWNYWGNYKESYLHREEYNQNFQDSLLEGSALVVIGPRRSGKSAIMRQIGKQLVRGGVTEEQLLFVNLEDPRFENLSTDLLDQILTEYDENVLKNSEKKPYVFLDEIQDISGWEKWVRSFQDLNRGYLILSGSNARLLSSELSTLLTGRHIQMPVFPLNFNEFLKFREIDISSQIERVKNKNKIHQLFDEYLLLGGFPQVVLESQVHSEILKEYFKDIVQKDLIRRFEIRKTRTFQDLAHFCLSNTATATTYKSVAGNYGISTNTAEQYMDYLQSAYLVQFLKRFSFKVKEQDRSPRKMYAIDSGLASVVGFQQQQYKSRLLETVIFLEIQKKLKNHEYELFYYRDLKNREVDFVIEYQGKRHCIQVTNSLKDYETQKREFRSLVSARKALAPETSTILVQEEDSIPVDIPDGIQAKSSISWCLEELF